MSRGRQEPPPSLETNVPCSVETAQCSASPGSTTTSIGAAGGVRDSHERAAVAADLDVGRFGVDGDDQVAGDLEFVVVGLRARRRSPRCRRGRWSGSGRGSRAARPPAGGPRRAGRRRPAKRTTRLPETVPAPWAVVSFPVMRSASFAPGARRNSAGPVPIMIVPSPGIDRDRVDRRAGAAAGRAAASRPSPGPRSWAPRSAPRRDPAAGPPLGTSLSRRSRRRPGRRSRTRARA